MNLENLNILIISPQKWGKMKLSKHHYATTLAENNNVYYLNPPSNKNNKKNTNKIDGVFILEIIIPKAIFIFKERIPFIYDYYYNLKL